MARKIAQEESDEVLDNEKVTQKKNELKQQQAKDLESLKKLGISETEIKAQAELLDSVKNATTKEGLKEQVDKNLKKLEENGPILQNFIEMSIGDLHLLKNEASGEEKKYWTQ